MKKLIFGHSLSETRKTVVAGLYLLFSVVMLAGFVPHVGFQEAVLAVVGPAYGVVGVFLAKNHDPADLQKALEALKAALMTAISFYVAVPEATNESVTLLITGIVMAVGVYWTRNAGQGAPATPRGP